LLTTRSRGQLRASVCDRTANRVRSTRLSTRLSKEFVRDVLRSHKNDLCVPVNELDRTEAPHARRGTDSDLDGDLRLVTRPGRPAFCA